MKFIWQPVHLYRCEFYSRFGAPLAMSDKHWNTYHRSRFKRLEGVKTTQAFFKTDPTAKPDKAGSYHNPFAFAQYQKAIKIQKTHPKPEKPDPLYDDFLTYQKDMAQYIVSELSAVKGLKANCDNEYTCVLLDFPKPELAKEVDWVNFVIFYYTAISVQLANERGLNCELVRRSGFGHLRPSVAETAPSMRINVGLIPKEYADVLVDAARLTHQLLGDKPQKQFAIPLVMPALKQAITKYNASGSKARGNVSVTMPETLWAALWTKLDKKGHSFIFQVMRKEINAESVVNRFLDQLIANKMSVEEIMASPAQLKKVFVQPWVEVLKTYQLNGKNQFTLPVAMQLPSYDWKYLSTPIEDKSFTTMVERLFKAFKQPKTIKAGVQTLETLYNELETASRQLFFNPPDIETDDGCGSDSETDETVQINQAKQKIYAKKFITATGMRSIQLAFASIKRHLGETTQLSYRNLGFNTSYMYYETNEALSKHAIRIKLNSVNDLAKPMKVVLYDLNHCNTTHEVTPSVEKVVKNTSPICILDMTSTTTEALATVLKTLLKKYPNLQTVVVVSSGLKNEQGGSDLNPYGTLRIFSRQKEERDGLYKQLLALEEEVHYLHPKLSHLLRKTAKEQGMTPTNQGILNLMR